jgi:glycosyltransferase involved in cell wall biosynthesis
MRLAVLFDNLGPYHLARLRAAAGSYDLRAVEFASRSREYEWNESDARGLQKAVIHQSGSSDDLTVSEYQNRLFRVLDDYDPSAVAVPGWGSRGALLALKWCLLRGIRGIVMSESTSWDEKRRPFREWVKRRIISSYSAALVGGTPQRDYMEKLGMPSDLISLGYDAVDNSFFAKKAEEPGGGGWDVGNEKRPYFLASARFIQKKNLFQLLRAYARYRELMNSSILDGRHSSGSRPWDLLLLGDGALRSDLSLLISDLGIDGHVQMPGFKQYEELPSYYAHAGAFIHASTTEQWGLVVNEAMASGLPVLVSNRCGCAADLVKEGENGWTFDPTNEEQMADCMRRISADDEVRFAMGSRSREIIRGWGPDRFAAGLSAAVNASFDAPPPLIGVSDRILFAALLGQL